MDWMTDIEYDELLKEFEELLESKKATPPPVPLKYCTCETKVILNFGCKCGGFEAELEREGRK